MRVAHSDMYPVPVRTKGNDDLIPWERTITALLRLEESSR